MSRLSQVRRYRAASRGKRVIEKAIVRWLFLCVKQARLHAGDIGSDYLAWPIFRTFSLVGYNPNCRPLQSKAYAFWMHSMQRRLRKEDIGSMQNLRCMPCRNHKLSDIAYQYEELDWC